MCAPKKQLIQLALIGATAYATGGTSLFATSAASATSASTLSTLANIARVAIPVIGAAGQVYTGYLQANMLKSQAIFTDYQATQESESYSLRKRRRARELARAIGQQRALYGVAGITLADTPGDIMSYTAANYAEDQYIDTFNTSQSILSKKFSSSQLRTEAKMAKISGWTGAAVTLGTRYDLFQTKPKAEYSTTRPKGLI